MQARTPSLADGPTSFLTPRGASVGASSTSLTPFHYQALINRGWRRSGTYYYKPDASHSCCVHYTIRLDATTFNARRNQRQAINRFNRYILGQNYSHSAARLAPKSREEKKIRKHVFNLFDAVHEPEYQHVKRPIDITKNEPLEPAHKFEVTLESDQFTEEKFALFENYQRIVHREGPSNISRDGFKRFLCSGFKPSTLSWDGRKRNIGSYHQCYRLDGKMIALGVLDLLPEAVSSVYLLYHEDAHDWNFGKLSALREISLAIEGGYRYYYMGYYIHSCTKMRYKAGFRTQQVLDPCTYSWDLLDDELSERLGSRRWVSMSLEKAWKIPRTDLVTFIQSDSLVSSRFQDELSMGLEGFKSAFEYVHGPEEGKQHDARHFSTVFQARMPGAMTLKEVEAQINLAQWKLKLAKRLVHLEDLIQWDEGDISQPNTLKCIAAELAACIGPDLVKEIALEFS